MLADEGGWGPPACSPPGTRVWGEREAAGGGDLIKCAPALCALGIKVDAGDLKVPGSLSEMGWTRVEISDPVLFGRRVTVRLLPSSHFPHQPRHVSGR